MVTVPVYSGKVVRVRPFGVIVEIDSNKKLREGFVSLRELSTTRVSDPNEIVEVGQNVRVKSLGQGLGQRLYLTMKEE